MSDEVYIKNYFLTFFSLTDPFGESFVEKKTSLKSVLFVWTKICLPCLNIFTKQMCFPHQKYGSIVKVKK